MPSLFNHALYCGDTTSDTAASYLAGLLSHGGLRFSYVPSDEPLSKSDARGPWKVLILSDYLAKRIPEQLQLEIVERVEAGDGLLMIGGWESFHGAGGDWNDTPLGALLPVEIAGHDDRHNCDRPLIVKAISRHPIIDDLPWNERPPLIGGLNRVACKPDDELLLSAEQFDMHWNNGRPELTPVDVFPLLAVGRRGNGRVAAFMSDVAPHWVGQLVDWGPERVRVDTHRDSGRSRERFLGIEVGNLYADFFTRLVLWTMGRL